MFLGSNTNMMLIFCVHEQNETSEHLFPALSVCVRPPHTLRLTSVFNHHPLVIRSCFLSVYPEACWIKTLKEIIINNNQTEPIKTDYLLCDTGSSGLTHTALWAVCADVWIFLYRSFAGIALNKLCSSKRCGSKLGKLCPPWGLSLTPTNQASVSG